MRTINKRTAGLLSASALALGLVAIAQPAMAGIADTRHNLGSAGTTGNHITTAGATTAEICVFCHTPHGSNTSVTAPLWNKASTGNTYSMYDSGNSATFDGDNSAGPGNISLACLTCHDGTQAMDNIINAPGAGGYSSIGGVTQASGLAYTWTGSGANAAGVMQNYQARIPNLGTDLVNDHPVGMAYCAATGNTVTTVNAASCNDVDFKTVSTAASRYWVETGGAGFQKTDLPLYSTGLSLVRVECATCHDPHTSTTVPFLRTANASSAVCLACHDK